MNTESPLIIRLSEIKESLNNMELLPLIEKGFLELSSGNAVIPPVGELLFDEPKGDAHIKYGYIQNQPNYVIKIASGFYDNPKLGINSSQGLMLVFSQLTGQIKAVLLDDGYLTDVRTVIASMITLKYLAPKNPSCIGIVGTGTQAKLQIEYLHKVSDCKKVMIWGRNIEKARTLKECFSNSDYEITVVNTLDELANSCKVIITTTPSQEPLLESSMIKKGTHITSLGSDTSEKIELDPNILNRADVIVSDSIAQSHSRGEVYRARMAKCIDESKVVELGNIIKNPSLGRQNDDQITVADLTGVAVQDIMIAQAVYSHFKS